MHHPLTPVALYQANLELSRQMVDAWQQCGEDWLRLGQHVWSGALVQTDREVDAIAHAGDAPALAAATATGAMQQWDHRCAEIQTVVEMAVANQTAFAANVSRAVQDWQRTVSGVVGTALAEQTA